MRTKLSWFLFVFLLLSACNAPATPTATPHPTQTAIPTPTLIPTPSTPLALLVLPADMKKETFDLYQKVVYDLAQGSGFRFQVRNTLTMDDVSDPTLKVVIVLPPDPGVTTLAAAAPQVQFLAINIPEVTAGGNISVLSGNSQPEIPAFMAGYIAAMTTPDYRIGMILPKDNADAQKALSAFSNGMTYYCGLCLPFYFVNWKYPQSIEIPADEDPARYSAYADYLILQRQVDTIYVYPDVATPELLNYIGTTGTSLLGVKPPDPLPAGWVVTLQPDVIQAIQAAWPNLIAGKGGVNVQSPLGFTDIDPNVLTPGKQQLAEQVLADLLAGRIVP
ncbi:MAG: hypothetical protein ACP5QU_00060 [Anaerolineae bacterium]